MTEIETLISLGFFFQFDCGTKEHLILEDKNIKDNLAKQGFIGIILMNLLMRGTCISLFL